MTKLAIIDLGETFLGRSDHPLYDASGVSRFVSSSVSNAIIIAGIVLIIIIIYAGLSMISVSGNAQQFERTRSILTSAIIGFVIVVASWFILNYIYFTTSGNAVF